MTSQDIDDIALITQHTVDELKKMIELVSTHHEVRRSSYGLKGAHPIEELHGTTLSKEYCNLDYPSLCRDSHFFSGVSLEILQLGRLALLNFRPENTLEPERKLFATIGLKSWQMLLDQQSDSSRADALKDVENAILRSLDSNEKGLERYRKAPTARL
ncbi:MAG: hypothetical protein ABL986_22535 [Vicinamibacterales bacterium]